MELKGKVISIGPIEEVGSNGFTKRQVVIETAGQYPQPIPVELHKDKCSLADALGIGSTVTAHIDLRGREHNGRYYVNVVAWKIEKETSTF
jgi:hypothetical protein